MLSALLLVPSLLAAEGDKKEGPVVNPEGVILANYGYSLTDTGDPATQGAQGFDVTRVYFGAEITRGERFGARIIFDVGRDEANAKEWVFLKYGYAEVKRLAPGVKVQAGMIPLPWIVNYDSFWGQRYVAKAFTDQFKVLKAADFGVGALGEHAKKRVDWHAVVINGEGFDNPGIDRTIAGQLRLTVDPLAGGEKNNLPLTGFVAYETPPEGGDASLVYVGAAGFRMPYVLLWGEYVGTSTGDTSGGGFSATVMPRVPKVVNVILRYDHWDPDTDAPGDAQDFVVAGVGHDFMKKVSLGVTYERGMLEGVDAATHGVFVKGQAGF